jgi:hypothetical protein
LSSDALAKAWFIYQTCVLQESGVLDQATAQQIIKQHMGVTDLGIPAAPPPAPAAPAAGSTDFLAHLQHIDEVQQRVAAEAEKAWTLVAGMAAKAGGDRHLKAFIARYESYSESVDGVDEPIEVPQVRQATAMLKSLAATAAGAPPAPAPAAGDAAACDGGDGAACLRMGDDAYYGEHGVAKDAAKAAGLYEKACTAKVAAGCFAFGYAKYKGEGVAEDGAGAVTLFRTACDGGDPRGARSWATRCGAGSWSSRTSPGRRRRGPRAARPAPTSRATASVTRTTRAKVCPRTSRSRRASTRRRVTRARPWAASTTATP